MLTFILLVALLSILFPGEGINSISVAIYFAGGIVVGLWWRNIVATARAKINDWFT